MINKEDFTKLRKDIHNMDSIREEVIHLSREAISLSKQVIYAAQRDDLKTAEQSLKNLKGRINKLRKFKIELDTSMKSVAMQEYVEAACFYDFVKNKRIPTSESLNVNAEEYLSGICDLTGELVRKAIYEVIHKNFTEAGRIKELVDDIYGEFLKLNLRNGDLRKKSDSIKWNLKKLEEVMYDISIKSR